MSDYSFDGLVGQIQRFDSFESKYVIPRRVDIWTPPSYQKIPHRRFKVLYMHDGENIFDSSSSKWSHMDWGIDETVTRLMTERQDSTHNGRGHVVNRHSHSGIYAEEITSNPGNYRSNADD